MNVQMHERRFLDGRLLVGHMRIALTAQGLTRLIWAKINPPVRAGQSFRQPSYSLSSSISSSVGSARFFLALGFSSL
jgi:hypothetical protein